MFHLGFLPLAFLVGAALPVLFYIVFPTVPTSDAGWYAARALELADGHVYQEGGWPTAYWPIGWPALLALGVWLTDSVTLGTLAINVTATLVSLYCVLWLGRRLTGAEGVARLAVAMLTIYPGAVAMASVPVTEPSYTAVMLGAFCPLVAASACIGRLMLVGPLFGVATLIKPQSLLFLVGAIIALLLGRCVPSRPTKAPTGSRRPCPGRLWSAIGLTAPESWAMSLGRMRVRLTDG